MSDNEKSREIDALFNKDYQAWLSIPENAQAIEIRRLETFAQEYNDLNTRWSKNKGCKGEVKRSLKKVRSFLFSQPQWKTLADRLFPFDSPWINLGNGFWYKREVDHYGREESLYYQRDRSSPRVSVVDNVQTDDGMLFSFCSNGKSSSFLSGRGKGTANSWAHRTDVSFEELVQTCAQKYLDFHSSLPWNIPCMHPIFNIEKYPKVTIKFEIHNRKGDAQGRQIYLDIQSLKSYHLKPLEGESFHSLKFTGSNVNLAICGGMGFYGSLRPYSVDKKVALYARPPFSEHPLVAEFMRSIIDDVSVFAELRNQKSKPAFQRLVYRDSPGALSV